MDGRRALVYARVRANELDGGETDFTRAERQQQVLQALTDRMTSPRTLVRMPMVGDDMTRPLATDLTTWELMQLGWIRFRDPRTIRCRLGGDAITFAGQSFIDPSEDNRSVIAMFVGASAPQPPRPGSGPFGPGCLSR
jgi:hypothetical protein